MQTPEEFDEFIEELKEASKDHIVVVEGYKDKRALTSLGIENILTLKRPLYAVVEHIVQTEMHCILLTDLDKAGKAIYAKLYGKLNHFGVKIDNSFREFLFKSKLRQIEGINRYIKTINKDK